MTQDQYENWRALLEAEIERKGIVFTDADWQSARRMAELVFARYPAKETRVESK